MEASHILRAMEDEEQSSSESGWTMYIGSSIHENDRYNNYVGEYSYNTYKQQGYDKNRYSPNYDGNSHNDAESDDSMASDASSGPSRQKLPSGSEPNLGMDQYYKHDESVKSVSTEKLRKQAIKRDQRRNKTGKEKLDQLKTISAPSRVQRGDISKGNQLYEPGRFIGVSQISRSYYKVAEHSCSKNV